MHSMPRCWRQACAGKKTSLKAALLDQTRRRRHRQYLCLRGAVPLASVAEADGLDDRRTATASRTNARSALVDAIKAVLNDAIKAGGSSLRDHRRADGSLGDFQHNFLVYDREGKPCPGGCKGNVKRFTQNGRSTFWCPTLSEMTAHPCAGRPRRASYPCRMRCVCQRRRYAHLLDAVFATLIAATAQYPDKPIRFIVPQAAGSNTDLYARLIAAEMSKTLGQQIIIENRPGAAFIVGLDAIAKAPPDGYTIGMGLIGGMAIAPHMVAKLPYDIEKDFAAGRAGVARLI